MHQNWKHTPHDYCSLIVTPYIIPSTSVWCSDGKESACSVGDLGSIPGLGRFLGEGTSNPFQYSCLDNPWQRSLAGLSSWDHKEWDLVTNIHTHTQCETDLQLIILPPSVWQRLSNLQYLARMRDFAVDFSSVAHLCPTLCHPMDCSMPGLPAHHQLPEFESVMSSNHLILCQPRVLQPSTFPSIRVFSNESAFRISGQSIGGSASTSSFQWIIRTDFL